jgi:hypothetical protein
MIECVIDPRMLLLISFSFPFLSNCFRARGLLKSGEGNISFFGNEVDSVLHVSLVLLRVCFDLFAVVSFVLCVWPRFRRRTKLYSQSDCERIMLHSRRSVLIAFSLYLYPFFKLLEHSTLVETD